MNVSMNSSASRSRIMDTDYAQTTADMARAMILNQAGSAMLSQANHQPMLVLALEVAALLAGAYTFVPSTLRRLLRGQIGVGTLMTIAAVGAVILGEVGEAAMLAFLYSTPSYATTLRRRGRAELRDELARQTAEA